MCHITHINSAILHKQQLGGSLQLVCDTVSVGFLEEVLLSLLCVMITVIISMTGCVFNYGT